MLSDREQVTFHSAGVDTDVFTFRAHLGSDPERAIRAVGGPFLDGFCHEWEPLQIPQGCQHRFAFHLGLPGFLVLCPFDH